MKITNEYRAYRAHHVAGGLPYAHLRTWLLQRQREDAALCTMLMSTYTGGIVQCSDRAFEVVIDDVLDPCEALRRISQALCEEEWGCDTCDYIAAVVRHAGYPAGAAGSEEL